jgi:methionine-rich copper-binding protein CopC
MYLRSVTNFEYFPAKTLGLWILFIALAMLNLSFNPAYSAGPRAVILEPLDGSYITSTPVTMRIKVTHPLGVISDSLQVSVDGTVIGSGDWSTVTPAGTTSEEIEYVKDISVDFAEPEGMHHIEVIDAFSSTAVSEGLSNGPVTCDFTYDSVAPEILRVFPVSGATTESVRPVVEVHFSEPVNIGDFTGDAANSGFTLMTSGKPVSGTSEWSEKNDILYFTPHEDIPLDTAEEADLQVIVRTFSDLAGNVQASTWTSSFQISAARELPPVITGTWPVNGQTGVEVASTITLTFSKNINKDTLLNKVRVINGSRTYLYPGQLDSTNHPDGAVFGFKTNSSVSNFQYNSIHTVIVDPGFKDTEGREQKEGYTFSFTTGEPPVEAPTNLLLTDHRPLTDETVYTLRPVLSFRFNREVDQSTVYTGFSLSDGSFDRAGSISFSADGKSFSFTPTQDLVADRTYTWTLGSSIKDYDGIGFGGLADVTQTGSFRIGKAPYVTGSTPSEGAEEVDISQAIKISFNTSMDSQSFNPATVRVSDGTNNVTLNRIELVGNDLQVEIAESGKTEFKGKRFYLYLDKTVSSVYGMELGEDFVLSFVSAGDAVKPYIESILPAPDQQNVSLSQEFIIEFSEPMNTSTVENAFMISDDTGVSIYNKSNGVFTWTVDKKIVRYNLNSGVKLSSGSLHYITIDQAAADASGNYLDDFNDSGLDGENYQISFTTVNSDLLKVLSTSPASSSSDNPSTEKIIITFSGPVKESSIYSSFSAVDSGNKVISGSISLTNDMETMMFIPDEPLMHGTVNVTLTSGTTGIRSMNSTQLDGNDNGVSEGSPADDYSFSFSVISPPKVVSSEPSNGANQIRQDIKIPVKVKYDQAMDLSSFNSNSVSAWLVNPESQDRKLIVDTFLLSDLDMIVNFEVLLGSMGNYDERSVKISISSDVLDQRGLNPAGNYDFTFTVNNPDRPLILMSGVSPADKAANVVKRPGIYIPFSEPMNRESAERAFSIAPLNQGQYIGKSGTFSWNDDSTAMTFVPSADLIEGVTYEIVFLDTATDVAGASLQAGLKYTFGVINTVPPSLVTTIPVDQTKDVAVDSRIVLIFSQPMDISTLSNIVISSDREVTIDRIETDPLSDVRYVLVPETLSPNKNYTLTIPRTVQDLRGNQLDQKYVVSFTTKGLGDTLEAGGFVVPGDPDKAVILVQTNEEVGSTLSVTVKQKGAPAAVLLLMKQIKSPKSGIYLYKGIYNVNRNSEFFGIAEVGVSASISGVLNNKSTTFIVRE